MTTIVDLLRDLTDRLRAAGIDSARLDARLLLAQALEVDGTWLFNHPNSPVDDRAMAALTALATRRCAREPMSLILGKREFWSLNFRVTRDTLAPRPDSETLIEAVLDQIADRQAPLSLLDLGTGTGCLLLALLSELPQARGLGVDRNPATLAIAAENAENLCLQARCRFLVSDWCERIDETFDIIIANPPYIATGDIMGLDPEVASFEPIAALDGGADGLDAYRLLAGQVQARLRPKGVAAFEGGAGQAADIAGLMTGAGLVLREVRRDLAGIERCVVVGN